MSESMTKSILIVDDEPDITTVLRKGLENEGFTVRTYNDPVEALRKFSPDTYDLVITDVLMPKLNGFELYSKMVKQDPRLKVGFLSGLEIHDKTYKLAHPESNIAFVLKKPLSVVTLVEKVKSELDEWRVVAN
jgi:DNA-binding NtrC family response regulator